VNENEYEPPTLTEVGELAAITRGQNGKAHADDSDGGGYWN
jgi:hypothetical protein